MIEPLRNMKEFGSRDEAEAARLLGTLASADPLPAVEQRVYASLGKPRRWGPRALRLASVTSVSLVAIGVLAMTMGILHRGAEPRASSTTFAPLPSPPPAAVTFAAPAAPAPLPAAETMPAPAPVLRPERSVPRTEPRTAPRPAIARAPSMDHRRTQTEPVAPVPSPAPAVDPVESTEARVAAAPPEEAALVLAGLRALRRQHDPARAAVLLARYLSRFPQGALVQEAMALSIEAELARGQNQAAAQLAGKYLDRFPAGRFVRVARKAAAQTAP